MKTVQVTSKHSFIHVIAREFKVNVKFMDRRWWELRPRMRVDIPYKSLSDMVKIQNRTLQLFSMTGYRPGIHMKINASEN